MLVYFETLEAQVEDPKGILKHPSTPFQKYLKLTLVSK